jgi:hypothetical protein
MTSHNRFVLYMLASAAMAGCASSQFTQKQPVRPGWIAHRG